MKKLLFCAGVLALAASCTEDFETSSVQQEQAKGISFVATDGNEAATKGHFEEDGDFVEPFWWAEQDRIAIISTNTDGITGANTAEEWAVGAAGANEMTPAVYKATKSQRKGWFTGINDNNILDFYAADKASQFLAIYPYKVGNGMVSIKGAKPTTGENIVRYKVSGFADLANQTQNDVNGNGIYENMIKYSYSTAKKENSYDAVGEKVDLNFQRVLSGMVFKTANASEYTVAPEGGSSIFGNLKTITATLVGVQDENAATGYAVNKETPALIYNETDANLQLWPPMSSKDEMKAEFVDWTENTNATGDGVAEKYMTSTVTMKNSGGLEWNDDARAYMVTLPLKLAKVTKTQYLKVEYKFANIDFEKYIPMTAKDWTVGAFVAADVLDINDYDYLLTNESSAGNNDRTLIVNKGDFADVFLASGNINWPNKVDATGVEKEEVKTIIVKEGVNVTKEDVAALNEFTNLASVTIPGVTEIPEGAFDGLDDKLETINMPDVTTIDEAFVDGIFIGLKNLNLHSYAFENETVNDLFFTTKDVLETLDMSGVDSMTPKFGVERTLSFQNFTALKEVTVQDGVRLCANAFSGCISLETVNGEVNMLNGTSAFMNDAKLTKIVVEVEDANDLMIPADAFNGCTTLTQIVDKDGKQIAPTSIGANAFESVASTAEDKDSNPIPLYMDLSKAKTIGASAFKNSALTSAKAGSKILTVGVETIEDNVFDGTDVIMVQFTNATKINDDVFANTTSLLQVKFLKLFTYGGTNTQTPSGDIFGGNARTADNVILFVWPGQDTHTNATWSGVTLKLKNEEYKFKSITVENFPYAEE